MKGKRSEDRLRHIKTYLMTKVFDSSCSEAARKVLRRQAIHYRLQGEELFVVKGGKQRRVVETLKERKELLRSFHSDGGHSGVRATSEKLAASFYWDHMHEDVKTFVSTCTDCQRTNHLKVEQPELQHITVSETLELVGMDLIGPLAETPRGNKYALTLVDYCTKFPEAFPLPSKEAEGICNSLVTFFERWGVPNRILSDRGGEFNNKLNAALCKEYGVKRTLAQPYHPQTNGLCERTNRTLKNRLFKFGEKTDWDLIPTQYQLPPELPPSPDEAELETRNDAAKRRREAACEKAMANQAKAHQAQGKAFLKRKNIGAMPCQFAAGQMVYFAVPIRQGSRKMKGKWQGPERILSIEKGRLHLANGKTVTRQQCKPHLTSALHDVSALSLDHQQSTSVSSIALDHPYAAHHNDRQCPFPPSTADQSSGQHEFEPTSDIPKALLEKGRKGLTCPGGIPVTPEGLETLEGNHWLDDSIIDGFLSIAVQEKNAVVLPSQLAQALASRDPASGWFQTQIRMSTLEWLLFPVCECNHWFMFVVNVPSKQMHILDSLPQEERTQRCCQIWMTFLERRADVVPNDLPIEGWKLGPLTSELQKGGDDCGVYVCMNGESMVKHGYPAQGLQPSAAARRHIYCTIVKFGLTKR